MKLIKMKLTSGQKISIIGSIICTVIVFYFNKIIQIENCKRANLESFVGKTIVIGKDTLMITDFNGSNDTYNLSNRVIIDKDYVLKHTR